MTKNNSLLIILLLFVFKSKGQDDSIVSFNQEQSYIRTKINELKFLQPEKAILQNQKALHSFYKKLETLKKNKKEKVVIVHLGDSHIQAGYFGGMVRRGLQMQFGNGGRGFVFPYRYAKSNGPHDYVSFSPSAWKYSRNVFANDTMPTGLSGFVLASYDSVSQIGITLRNNEAVEYSFNRLAVFSNIPGNAMLVSDSLNERHATLDSIRSGMDISYFNFPSYEKNFNITLVNNNPAQAAIVYGFNLMTDSGGVVYHNIGVNGAEYRHFLNQPMFMQQVKTLHADLYILSFGTNEAFNKSFNETTFLQTVDSTVQALRAISPQAEVLITSPFESAIKVKKGRYASNPNVEKIRNILQQFSLKNNCAFFDLYAACGGRGSMMQFAKHKMADTRRIHLNRTGYEMQGIFLLDAILKNYRP
jgi:lysophospholipase L1-like esterase